MAIDTENKRRSTLGVWGCVRFLPKPEGDAVDAGDRAHMWGYRGLFDVAASAAAGIMIQKISLSIGLRMG